MGKAEGRYPRQVSVQNLFVGGAEAFDDLADAHRIPNQHCVGQQAQATRLVHDLVEVAGAELAAIGEEKTPADQVVPIFPAIQL